MTQSTALAIPTAAPVAQPDRTFSQEQIEIVKRTIMANASDMELAFFLEMCRHKRLDPFSGQIVATKRRVWNKDTREYEFRWVYQTTIDGMRSIAEDSGEYEGCDPAEWCGADGEWRQVWLDKAPPLAAKVVAYRRGRRPAVAVANYEFFCQTFKESKDSAPRPTEIWQKGAPHMLAKCAEALALRKAFPRQLGAVYSKDELQGAGVIDVEPAYEAPPVPTTSELVSQAAAPPPPPPPAPAAEAPPPPAASAPPPVKQAQSASGPAAGAGGSSQAPRAPATPAATGKAWDDPKALAQRVLSCKTELELNELAADVQATLTALGDQPMAGDLHRIYGDHKKTLRKAAAVPRGPEPAKSKPAASKPPARGDDEPPPPTDEDR